MAKITQQNVNNNINTFIWKVSLKKCSIVFVQLFVTLSFICDLVFVN